MRRVFHEAGAGAGQSAVVPEKTVGANLPHHLRGIVEGFHFAVGGIGEADGRLAGGPEIEVALTAGDAVPADLTDVIHRVKAGDIGNSSQLLHHPPSIHRVINKAAGGIIDVRQSHLLANHGANAVLAFEMEIVSLRDIASVRVYSLSS